MGIAKQQGFTLIELVMVIVVLGILAATALPKFADLGSDARTSSITAASGAVKSAMAIAHAQSIIDGNNTAAISTITLEGIIIDMKYGYPAEDATGTNNGISEAAGLGSEYSNTTGTIKLVSNTTCQFVYAEATSASAAASVGPVTGC